NPGYTATWFSTNQGGTWSTTHPAGLSWQSVACSGDGTKAVVSSGSGTLGPFYWSPDAGATSYQITNSDAYGYGGKLAMSADAVRLAIAVNRYPGGPILISTNSGSNWTSANAPNTNWHATACSADGGRFVAVVNGGQIYAARTTVQPLLSIA